MVTMGGPVNQDILLLCWERDLILSFHSFLCYFTHHFGSKNKLISSQLMKRTVVCIVVSQRIVILKVSSCQHHLCSFREFV